MKIARQGDLNSSGGQGGLVRLLRKRWPRADAVAALGPEGATGAFALRRVQVPGYVC